MLKTRVWTQTGDYNRLTDKEKGQNENWSSEKETRIGRSDIILGGECFSCGK